MSRQSRCAIKCQLFASLPRVFQSAGANTERSCHLLETFGAFGSWLDVVAASDTLVCVQIVVLIIFSPAMLVITAHIEGAHGRTHEILLIAMAIFIDTMYGLVIFLENSRLVLQTFVVQLLMVMLTLFFLFLPKLAWHVPHMFFVAVIDDVALVFKNLITCFGV